jgi:hypothetical protein
MQLPVDTRVQTILFLFATMLLGEPAAVAQEPAGSSNQTQRAEHKFLDRLNLGLTGMEAGALLADGIYTQRGLKKYGWRLRERDPIARPFVDNGWVGQIAGGAIFLAADLGLRHVLHSTGHHRIERMLPFVLTAYGLNGAIRNARTLRRIERGG